VSANFSQEDFLALPPERQLELLPLLEELAARGHRARAKDDFYYFCQSVYPGYVKGTHLKLLCEKLDAVARGEIKRLIIAMPPRHSKSQHSSIFFPAYFLGRQPNAQIITASHTADLAKGFGRKVRDLIDSTAYRDVFGSAIALRADVKAAGQWQTDQGGAYYAAGVDSALAGRGASLLCLDDLIDEQKAIEAQHRPEVFEKVYEWYLLARQRLMPGGAVVLCACVEENQRVAMADGSWRPIKDVRVNDSVIAHGADRSATPRRVSAVIPQKVDDLIEIVSRSCAVKVNARHPFLVVRGGLKTAARTQVEVNQAHNWALEWVRADALQPGDTVVTLKSIDDSQRKIYRPYAYDGLQMSQEHLWGLGFLFGDGWLVKSSQRGVVGLCIAAGVYPELNDRAVAAVSGMLGGVNFTLRTKARYYRAEAQAQARWLQGIGFDGSAHTKRIPEWVYRLRAGAKRAFLRGFFAADGYLRKAETERETYRVGLCNRELLDDLRLLARTCGVKTTKIRMDSAVGKPPNTCVARVFTRYSAEFSFRENMIELSDRYRRQDIAGNQKQHFRFEDVEIVRPAGRGMVYDLTVEGDENFVAEGFVTHNTRWALNDPTGLILERSKEDWEILTLPALWEDGRTLWPEFWKPEEILKLKEEMPPLRWSATYQQAPEQGGGTLIQPDWLQWWPHENPPKKIESIIVSLDPAFSDKDRADPSAFVVAGIFTAGPGELGGPRPGDPSDAPIANIIVLDAFETRENFPDLKQTCVDIYRQWRPEGFMIEAKASGVPLIQELKLIGLPVTAFDVNRGTKGNANDKISRVNRTLPIYQALRVWLPENRAWADHFATQLTRFPMVSHDDLVDAMTQILVYFRNTRLITTPTDDSIGDFSDSDSEKPGLAGFGGYLSSVFK